MDAAALPHARSGPFEGPLLVASSAAALLVMAAIAMVASGTLVEGLRLTIRLTARTSLLLFLAAFVASAAVRLRPGVATRWLLRNRRYLGLSFATSHLIHAAAIVALARLDPALFWRLSNPGSIVSGGIVYVFILALAATSSDRAVRGLGPRAWRRLHGAGVWVIWLGFMVTFGKRVPVHPAYALALVLLVGALIARLAARRSRR